MSCKARAESKGKFKGQETKGEGQGAMQGPAKESQGEREGHNQVKGQGARKREGEGKGQAKGKGIGGKVPAKSNPKDLERNKIWQQVFLTCSTQGWSIGDAKAEASNAAKAHVQWLVWTSARLLAYFPQTVSTCCTLACM